MNSFDDPFHDLPTLSVRETATLLAALRYWQRQQAELVGRSAQRLPEDAVATRDGTFAPLRRDEIDRLCAKLAAPAAAERIADEVADGVLVSPHGVPIVGTAELIPATAVLVAAVRGADGLLDLQFADQTTVDWDGQRTLLSQGDRCYVDEGGRCWRECELHLVSAI